MSDGARKPVTVDTGLALAMLRDMVRIRRFEERCADLYGQQKIRGFLHLYIGEEAVAAGAMRALAPDDAVVATYREHGHARKRLGAAVAPKEIAFLPTLPRTRSGKIMRRLLKARELGLPEGDLSTLEAGAEAPGREGAR